MDEQEEFEQYEEHIKWLELAKEDIATWISCVQTEAQTDQQRKRTHLFLVRFSNMLGMSLNCTGCGITWDKGKDFWGCLNCPNVNLCGSCNLCGVNPDGHSETHDAVYLRVWCDGCGGCIVGTRYHCSECKEMNLCTGCHFSGKFPERHIVTHKVTRYPVLTPGTKNTDEQQELQHYEENMKWVEDAKKDFNAWRSGVWKKVVTNHHLRRVLLFLARFSHVIGGTKICDGCGTDLVKGTRQFFCLTCLKVILCNSCHESGEKPERHLKTHDILGMRFLCESCDSYIVGARYHCGKCKNGVDLCTGCHSSGKFPKGHTANHEMTKFPPETASSGGYRYDSKAFLFSLVNKPGWAPVKLPQTGTYGSSRAYSIHFHSSYGPIFGGGNDFYIYNYASSNTNSASNLGHTYGPPRGYSYGTTSARTFLAGSYHFTPDEIETFYETTYISRK